MRNLKYILGTVFNYHTPCSTSLITCMGIFKLKINLFQKSNLLHQKCMDVIPVLALMVEHVKI